MVFSSIPFVFFLFPICLALYYSVPFRAKNSILLIFSLMFYAWGEPVYIILMIFTSFVNYITGIILEKKNRARSRKLILAVCIIINLLLLGFFKYGNFVIDQMNALFRLSIDELKLSLPIGISFYTFQTMSYSIDVYRKDYPAEKNFFTFMTYVTMFPQLIAGPIVRFSNVRSELHQRTIDFKGFSEGMLRFLRGLFKKVLIANNIGMLWDAINAESANGVSALTAWLGAAAFTFQLYFDFSGYSDMAIGMGVMLGFNFNENFDHPFISKSVTEFWRRWHMSLSTWFRDYVYIPLGGNRKGLSRNIINILIVWALTGFWHGAAWNFMFWGVYYGILLILEKFVWGKLLERTPKIIRHIYLMAIVIFGFTIFVFDDLNQLMHFVRLMFGVANNGCVDSHILFYLKDYAVVLAMAIVFSMPTYAFAQRTYDNVSNMILKRILNIAVIAVYVIMFVITIAYIVSSTYNPFLYFRF